jgi:hypothetical protein
VSFPISSLQCIGLWVKLDGQVLQKSYLPQPFQCGNLFATITWFVWIAAIGEEPYAAT